MQCHRFGAGTAAKYVNVNVLAHITSPPTQDIPAPERPAPNATKVHMGHVFTPRQQLLLYPRLSDTAADWATGTVE